MPEQILSTLVKLTTTFEFQCSKGIKVEEEEEDSA